MKMSNMLISTLREVPAEAEIDSHKYEDLGDWFRWFFWAGGPFILSKMDSVIPFKKAPFIYHDSFDPFIYTMKNRESNPFAPNAFFEERGNKDSAHTVNVASWCSRKSAICSTVRKWSRLIWPSEIRISNSCCNSTTSRT